MSDEKDLSQRYRELPNEEPPRALDEAILAASRRAVEARPAPLVAPTGRRRWYFPLAAAAIIVLAVAVTMHVERERPDEEGMPVASVPVEPKPQAAEPAPAKPAAQPAPRAKVERRDVAPEAFPSHPETPAPREAPAAAAPAVPPAQERKLYSQRDEMTSAREAEVAGARSQVQRAPALERQASATVAANLASQSPERMLQGIVDLRRQGRHEEADKALAEFRKRYPDYRLSEEMKAKVERSQ